LKTKVPLIYNSNKIKNIVNNVKKLKLDENSNLKFSYSKSLLKILKIEILTTSSVRNIAEYMMKGEMVGERII